MNRRDFLKLSSASLAGLATPRGWLRPAQAGFPLAERLCRVTEPHAKLLSRPDPDSREVGLLEYDDVLVAYRKVVGRGKRPNNHVWIETPEGFLWSSEAQPVRNQPNPILEAIPEEGIWTEVTIPHVEGRVKPDPLAPVRYRLYYDMVLNVEARVTGTDGRVWYRVHDENGVVMYAPGESFRMIPPEEIEPISPGVEDKAIYVNLARQDLSAVEAGVEVYYTHISSGYAFFPKDGSRAWNTPIGQMWTWRKMVSRHMSGGNRVAGYDLPGVGWTNLFSGNGAAIHATYWHNDFGAPRSAGCINVRPAEAKWLFRWSQPLIPYRPGDVTVYWPDRGTRVIVQEG